jgi:signal transduction histidine kinase
LDFSGNGWTLLLHIPTKIAFASAIQLRNSMIGILSVVAILTSIVSHVFSRTISKPIIKLKNAAVEIGKAKLDTRIDINSKDEIGELAAAFNNMAYNLNKVTASRDALNKEIAERKRTQEELQNTRDGLEVRVKQRTADLAKANEDLRKEIKERKLVEDALRIARDDWENIFESISDIVVILDRDRRVLDCNRFAVTSIRKTKKQIVGQFCYDVFQCKEHSEGRCLHEELLVSERPDTIDMEMEMLSGIYLVTIAPVFDSLGNVIKTIHIAKDITHRKKSEKKLLVYQDQLRSLASELLLAEERLRRRIAIDVHDHIGQKLAISKIKIKSLCKSVSSQSMAKALNDVGDLITQTIESSRSLTFELSPPVLYELGFEAAVEWLVRHTKQQNGLSVSFTDDDNAKPLDNNVRVFLFQAVRELLVNVVKHAQAYHLTVSTQKVNGEIQIDIEDDGIGFEVSQIRFNNNEMSGFGLFSIRERLEYIGGKLKIYSRSGCGTKVVLTAPLSQKHRKGESTNEYENLISG